MLLAAVMKQHGVKGAKYVEFALANGISTRTNAYDLLLLHEADAAILESHKDDPVP